MTAIVTLTPNPAIDVWAEVDRVEPSSKLRCTALRRDPGGGGINVARVAKRLGTDVTAIYPAGGVTGQLLRKLLDREAIIGLSVDLAEETREDFTISESSTGQEYRFVMPGPRLADAEWQSILARLASFPARPSYLVASGSLPPGVPDDFYARAFRIGKQWGARTVIDTSGGPLKLALAEGVYLIKPNLREFAELVGARQPTDTACLNAARGLIAEGRVQIVALSLGHRGALLVSHDGAWRAAPLPIKAMSRVGAGDSFLGGMISALSAGQNLESAFRIAVAAGSAALLHAGTGLSQAPDVARLAAQVVIAPA
jgi:6-phosphofructokinase 2